MERARENTEGEHGKKLGTASVGMALSEEHKTSTNYQALGVMKSGATTKPLRSHLSLAQYAPL
jgi:hypothetical protein